VAGLLAASFGPPVALLVAAGAALLGGRAALALAAALAVLAGASLGGARLDALHATALGPAFGHEVTVRGVALEPPRPRTFGGHTALVRLASGRGRGERVAVQTRAAGGWRARSTASGGAAASGGPGRRGPPPSESASREGWPVRAVGAQVRISGLLRRLRDKEAWLGRRGAHAVLVADAIQPTGRRRGGVPGAVDRLRERAEDALAGRLPTREGALLRGMVLGEDDALPAEVRDDFRAAGLSHIVAASGQNIVLLGALALPLLALMGLGLRARLGALLGLTALYVPLAGGGPSIQRAGIMGAAGVAAMLAGRPAQRFYALGLAAAVTLALNPASAGDPGWQLSFAAVVAIFLLAPRLAAGLSDRRVPGPLAEAAGLTAAATLGTAPLLALHFERLSLVSLPVNVLAAPVVALAMWVGFAAGAVAQLAPAAGVLLALPAAPLLGFLTGLAHVAARLPHAQLGLHLGVLALLGVYALGAVVVLLPRARRPALAASALAVLAALAWPAVAAPSPPAEPRALFLDIGQGDATLLQAGPHAVLVDAGPPDGPILARLRDAGVTRLDLAVITHAQADHEGGMGPVLRTLPVGALLDGGAGARTPEHRGLAALAATRHVPQLIPDAGQVLIAGPIRLRILSPEAEPAALQAGEDPNLRAVVAEGMLPGLRVLLTADAESDVTLPLPLEPVDVLKVAHHGSDDPGLPELLTRLRPREAVIEVGAHNSYGHPTPSTLTALHAAGVPFMRTDKDGTVEVRGRASPSGARRLRHP